MIDYRVRSVSLLNLVNDVRKGNLIPDAYFQRNLVWREIHNKDFIKTILLGYPFPQIFISKGKVNVEKMSTVSCIVDGQQRTSAIINYIGNKYDVDGKYYKDLSENEQSDFLKYEIAVIELDLENDDPKVLEIFQRINRTSNALSAIEKLASEYATSEYMLVGKLLADQIDLEAENDNEDFKEDPNIPKEFFAWARMQKVTRFQYLLTRKNVFTPREIARKTHLMFVLNIMSTILTDFFARNERTTEFLDDYALDFEEKDRLVTLLEASADLILKLKLNAKSYWFNKSNIYSLLIKVAYEMPKINQIDITLLRDNLDKFEGNVPTEYRLAAAEAVNNRKERELRNQYLIKIFEKSKKKK